MMSLLQCLSFAKNRKIMRKVGDGTRALNFFIDTVLITILAMLLRRWWNFYVMYWGYPPINFGWFFFGTTWLYYFLFESIFAKSPAKWLTQTKVVTLSDRKPSFFIIFWRSLLRITVIDLFFGPFLDGPLHDYASKTKVVEG
ncbi:MAG: hypothetical protein EAZ12_01705 [Sphingobacteriia bacterium]|nr:MAG: hypothetical protein EAZ12_01705 [Sphingobacteriia bacterium]